MNHHAEPPREHQFDDLAKALAGELPRREVLRRLGGGLFGALLAALGLARPAAAQACPPGTFRCGTLCCDNRFKCCSNVCLNPANNRFNCGACGNACAANQICCSGQCVNPKTDANHCGGCLEVCLPGQSCVNGFCRCPAGQVLCYGRCSDRATDRNNCGGCGLRCPAGQDCCRSTCRPACPSPQTYDSHTCTCVSPCSATCADNPCGVGPQSICGLNPGSGICLCAQTVGGTCSCFQPICLDDPEFCDASEPSCPEGFACVNLDCCGDSFCAALCDTEINLGGPEPFLRAAPPPRWGGQDAEPSD